MAAPLFYNQGDQAIYNLGSKFVPQEKYRLDYTAPTTTPTAAPVSSGITNTNAFTNSGGDNNFNTNFSNNPYMAQPSGNFVTNRSNYSNTGYIDGLEPEETFMDKAGGLIKKGIGMVVPGGNFLMGMAGKLDNFKNLSATDKAFAEMQMGNQEQSMYGGNLANQDRYGYNKRSMFGNYSNVITDRVEIANKRLAEGKELRDIDKYYLEKEKEKTMIDDQMQFNDFVNNKKRAVIARRNIKAGTATDPGAALHSELGSGRVTSSVIQGEGGGNTPGTSRASDHGGVGLGHNAGNVRAANKAGTGSAQSYNQNLRKGGRAGYFFGGRVNFKNGGLASIL